MRFRSKHSASSVRQLIARRQNGDCFYCGQPLRRNKDGLYCDFVRDHLRPKSKGGPDHHHNRVAACRNCDREKRDRWPSVEEVNRQLGFIANSKRIETLAVALRTNDLYVGHIETKGTPNGILLNQVASGKGSSQGWLCLVSNPFVSDCQTLLEIS